MGDGKNLHQHEERRGLSEFTEELLHDRSPWVSGCPGRYGDGAKLFIVSKKRALPLGCVSGLSVKAEWVGLNAQVGEE